MQVSELFDSARDAMTVKRVYGDPFEKDGVTVIPAVKIGGGAGGGGDTGEGSGGGFGLMARPAGAYVIRDGDVTWQPAVDVNRIVMGGQIIAVATDGDRLIAEKADHVITIPKTLDALSPILAVIPLQLLAYYIAVERGCDVDQPRNLAKSVTVE